MTTLDTAVVPTDVGTVDLEATDLSSLEVEGRQVLVASFGQGMPLLYLHGLCDLHSVLAPEHPPTFLSALAGWGRVVAPALPGYPGSSPLGRLHEMEDYVFHLVDVLEALVLDDQPLAVMGHCLGGWLATELALRRPDLVSQLVLLAPLGLHVPSSGVPPVFGALAPRGVGGFAEARRILFSDPDSQPALAALPDDMAESQQLRWFGGLAGAAAIGWKAPHFQSRRLAQRLHRVGAPALVVCGGRDALVPAALRSAWTAGLAGAQALEVPDAGHALVLEQPGLADVVTAFLGWR